MAEWINDIFFLLLIKNLIMSRVSNSNGRLIAINWERKKFNGRS